MSLKLIKEWYMVGGGDLEIDEPIIYLADITDKQVDLLFEELRNDPWRRIAVQHAVDIYSWEDLIESMKLRGLQR